MFGNMVYSAEACAGSSTRQGHSKARDPVQAETGKEGMAPGALHWAVRAAGTPVPCASQTAPGVKVSMQ